jgi:hypothetical protein
MKLNLIASFVTDIALLLMMLVGLLRLRNHDGGTFGLVQVLWKQVCLRYSLAIVISIH